MSLDVSMDDIFSFSNDVTPQKENSNIISRGEMDKSTFSIDDELADFLGESSTPISNIKKDPVSISKNGDVASTEKKGVEHTDTNDFMNWLSDVTDTNILETKGETNQPQSNQETSKTIESTPSKVTETETKDSFSMDSFLEDLLGNDSKPITASKVPTTTSGTDTIAPKSMSSTTGPDSITFSAESSVPTPASTSEYVDFDQQIDTILKSSFPNISKLKDIITRHMGYIPDLQRGPIWNLLLTGQLSEDFEATSVGSSSMVENENKVVNIDKLVTDVEEIICNTFLFQHHHQQQQNSVSDKTVLKQSLQNIIVLYCTRKQVPYQSYLLSLLAPLLTSYEPIPVSIASSCFYNLVTDFIPFTETQVYIS